MKIHLAHQRGPDSSPKDAKCGVWWPKQVSQTLEDVTCKACLRVYKAQLSRNSGILLYKHESVLQN